MPNSLTKRTALRDSLVPASCKPQYELIVKGSTNTTGFSAPAVTQTPPTAQVLFTESMRAARFYFAGVGSAGDTINYRFVAWVPLEPTSLSGGQTLVPIVIASGRLDLGSLVITTIVAGAKVVDTITDTIGRQGTVIWNPTDNTPASILVDVQNALILELETDLATGATAAYAWGAPVDGAELLAGLPVPLGSTFIEKANSIAARIDGTSVGAVALTATSTRYVSATVLARKPVTDTDKASVANTGTVWICGAAENIDGAWPLIPGDSMALPENGDLSKLFLAVDTLHDGVSIITTT